MNRFEMQVALAAALAAGCGAPAKKPVENHGGSGSGSARSTSVLPATCKHGELNFISCGGAEVAIDDLAACGLPTTEDAKLSVEQCTALCGDRLDVNACTIGVTGPESKSVVLCPTREPCMGRLASDGELAGGAYTDEAIDHLARAHQMEARSVDAFVELAADLARWGAPDELVAACREAAVDEARHADLMAQLLRARGVTPAPVDARPAPGFASLRELALHNEREGVAGESVGALAALVQANRTEDADVRAALIAIADDEAAHAVLSLAISAWARSQGVDAAELDAARHSGFQRLEEPQAPDAIGWPAATAIASLSASVARASS